jgi:carboxylesterase
MMRKTDDYSHENMIFNDSGHLLFCKDFFIIIIRRSRVRFEQMKNRTGILIIHGFAGNIKEISPVAEYFSESGYGTLCVELKGHTGKRRDLARSNWREWIESAEKGLELLLEKYDNVIIIGFSMGGLIAANLIRKYKVRAVVFVNTPVYFWDFKRIGLNLIEDIRNRNARNLMYYCKSCMDKPFLALLNFMFILSNTKPLFKNISCPVFIGQSLKDDTAHYKSAQYIFKSIQAEKYVEYYGNSGHVIFLGPEKDRIIKDIEGFIMRV